MEPEGAEQVQCESLHVGIDITPQVRHYKMTLNLDAVPMMWMIQMVWYMHLSTFKI